VGSEKKAICCSQPTANSTPVCSLLNTHLQNQMATPTRTPARTSAPTPCHFWHTLETTASPKSIWHVWTTVSDWHIWDNGLRSAKLDGTSAFRLGTTGTLVSLNGTKSAFSVTAFEGGTSYTFTTALPLAALHVRRTLEQTQNTTRFTHEVWFDGLFGGIFAALLGKNFMHLLPSVMDNVRSLAEEKTRQHKSNYLEASQPSQRSQPSQP
jgi:Polyketide cyclase / dehydrase and lipid transport